MIVFADPQRAVLCSNAVQQALHDDADPCGRNGAMAARVADLADGGEILISDSVRAQSTGCPMFNSAHRARSNSRD